MKISWEYLAGFFDGEGNISIYDFKRNKTLLDRPKKPTYSYQEQRVILSVSQGLHFRILLTQKRNIVLEKIKQFLNENNIKCSLKTVRLKNSIYKKVKATDDIETLTITGGHTVHLSFLEKIEPYLIVKKEKAQLAINFIKHKKWKRSGIVCTIDGCKRKYLANGLCKPHYMQEYRKNK